MTLSDEMRRLVQHLREADDARMAAIVDIHTDTRQLLEDTQQELDAWRATRQAMAEEQRQRLAAERNRLASEVASMLDRWRSERSELRMELSQARQVWQSASQQMQQRRAGKAPPEDKGAVEEEAAREEVVTPDDLTAIRGIGAAMQARLNAAGIDTYARLARRTPAELRSAIGEMAGLANVTEWIAQARELAGQA